MVLLLREFHPQFMPDFGSENIFCELHCVMKATK